MAAPRLLRKIRNDVDVTDIANQEFRRTAREREAARDGASRMRREAERLKREKLRRELGYV